MKAGQLRWVCALAEDSRVEQLLELVRTGEYGSQRSLATALGVTVSTVNDWKQKAVTKGHISEFEWAKCLKAGKTHCATSDDATEHADNPDF